MKSYFPTELPAAPAGGSRTKALRLLAVLCLAFTGSPAFAENAAASVNFKDSTQPGRLKIYVSRGDLHVHAGESPTEVSVRSDATPDSKQEPRGDGLRVLSDTSANFSLTVKDNNAELTYGRDSWPQSGSADFDVTVPRNTAVEIENGWGGDITVEKLAGDIEIKGMNCEVKLVELSGGATVETMNGEINATFAQIPADKPISFSSMNGEVNLRIPSDSKAKVRFRTHHGTILTNFPESILKTTSENLGGDDWASYGAKHVAIAVNIAKEVGIEVANATKEMAEEIKEAQHEAKEEAAIEDSSDKAKDHEKVKVKTKKLPRVPRPPRPPNIPAISGGKVVSGAINGGGPEILITTMNGDITLRSI